MGKHLSGWLEENDLAHWQPVVKVVMVALVVRVVKVVRVVGRG
jgi:hypothetical protein